MTTPETQIEYFDPEQEDAMVTFLLVLLAEARYSHLPELLHLLGAKKTLEFLSVFGGSIIRVPSPEELNTAARDVDIYMRLEKAKENHEIRWRVERTRLRRKYGVSFDQLDVIYDRLHQSFGPIYEVWRQKRAKKTDR